MLKLPCKEENKTSLSVHFMLLYPNWLLWKEKGSYNSILIKGVHNVL